MLRYVLRVSTLAAILAASAPAVFAADILYPPPPPPPHVEMRPTIHDWSGGYVGAAVGVASMHSLYLPSAGNDPELSGNSATITGLVGYSVQRDNIVVGVEADITYANLKARNRLDEVELEIPFISTARVKVGYAINDTLIYATAGVGVLTGKMRLTAFNETDKKTHYGYVIGGGMETRLTENVNMRLEYLYGDFGKKTYNFTPGNVSEDISSLHLVRAGMTYNFAVND